MLKIGIILARGGSKRLPRKNILPFNGKPLIGWTIEAAVQSAVFDRVLVSTDDEEIRSVALNFGAEVPFLRSGAADDQIPSSEATIFALRQAEAHWGCKFDLVAQLMANCPLRDAQTIRDAVDAFSARDMPALISCFKYGWMNPWWAVRVGEEGRPEPVFPEALLKRSQDLPTLYCPTGAIWLAKSRELLANKSFYAPGHVFHPIDWVNSIDIDDEDDLRMANVVFEYKKKR